MFLVPRKRCFWTIPSAKTWWNSLISSKLPNSYTSRQWRKSIKQIIQNSNSFIWCILCLHFFWHATKIKSSCKNKQKLGSGPGSGPMIQDLVLGPVLGDWVLANPVLGPVLKDRVSINLVPGPGPEGLGFSKAVPNPTYFIRTLNSF